MERLQHALHGWVAFAIMPLFALANAGVALGSARLDGGGQRRSAGCGAGARVRQADRHPRVFVGRRARPGSLPCPPASAGRACAIVGLVAGIGFTMALFIAALAFPKGPLIEVAKLGILAGSGVAAVIGSVVGRLVLSAAPAARAAKTLTEAETSTSL